jgi:hypothetical protein
MNPHSLYAWEEINSLFVIIVEESLTICKAKVITRKISHPETQFLKFRHTLRLRLEPSNGSQSDE